MANERVIVIGAGGISNAWFPPIRMEALTVAAVVDLRLEAAQGRIDEHHLAGAKAFNDVDKALAETKADFVVDLTIPDAHCEVTCKALKAGFHVVGEKPMAGTMEQARKMVKTSEETGKLYMVSQSRRWDSRHIAIQRQIVDQSIGRLTTLNCDFFLGVHFGGFRDEMPSPLILDMAIHHFDLARMFAHQDPISVYAEEFNPHGSWYKGDVAANCLFEMTNGVRFAYRGSWCAEGCHTGWNGDWRAIGDKGTIVYDSDKNVRGEVVTGTEGFSRAIAPLSLETPEIEAATMHGALREMLHFLRTGKRPQTECHDNIKSLAMVFAAIESSKRGTRVKLSEV